MISEVDVCYLTERGLCTSRKTQGYDTGHQAGEIFKQTIKKFKLSKQHALITLRDFDNGKWLLIKSERT